MNDLAPVPAIPSDLAAVLASDPAARHLEIALVSASTGGVVLSMAVSAHLLNTHHSAHGGLVFALGDTCFGFVCEALGRPAVSRQAEISFIAPGRPDSVLFAHGREVLRYGRNNIVDVSIRDDLGRRVAELRVHGSALRTDHSRDDR